MHGYRIKSLNQWTPNSPAFSCPDIDAAIRSMENVRDINDDLRSSFNDAVDIIETLDDMVIELQEDLGIYRDDLKASDRLIKKLEEEIEEVREENDDLKAQIETLKEDVAI